MRPSRGTLTLGLSVAVCVLLLGSSAAWVVVSGRRPAPTTFIATADASVNAAEPEANFGDSPALRTGATPELRSYLRFTVRDVPGRITGATLRVWARKSDPGGFSVHPVASLTWAERRITDITAPAMGPPSASAPAMVATWAEVDVTDLVGGEGEVSFALTSTGADELSFESRESAHKPELVVETRAQGPARSRDAGVVGAPSPRTLPQMMEDVTRSTRHRYRTKDDRGQSMDTLKVIENPAGGYLGVYHNRSDEVFSTMVGTSPDLMIWTYRATLDVHASQPTVASAGAGFIVAAENDDSGLADPVSRWLRFRHYPSVDALLKGEADRTFDAPHSLVRTPGGFEGTPNFFLVRLVPDIDHSAIDVGFHYYANGVDRQGRGTLTDFSTWVTAAEPELDAALESQGVVGNIGDRDAFVFGASAYTVIEGQLARGDFGSWRTYLVDPRRGQANEVRVKTHKGSEAFANPAVTDLRAPSGRRALFVSLFLPRQGAGSGEQGQLLYYTEYGEEAHRPAPIVAAAGDIACRAKEQVSNTECRQQATSDVLMAMDPTAVLALGDAQYETGRLAGFQESYDPTWGRLKHVTYPVPGNHEYGVDLAAGYYDYFGAAAGDRTKGYYSFDLGSWHLIALNSNCAEVGGCGPGSPQLEWLRADLARHSQGCTLAYWHHPRFSSGEHGSDTTFHDFWQLLYDAGADVVLAGHEHGYERFAPQDPAGQLDDARGLRQFVVGTGGKGLDRFRTIAPNSEARNSDTFGVLKLTLGAGAYEWEFVAAPGGSFADNGRAACHER